MALPRALNSRLILAGLVAASSTLAGCLVVPTQPPEDPEVVIGVAEKTIGNAKQATLIIEGTVYGLADMSSGDVVAADAPNLDVAIDLPGVYRVRQFAGARKAVQNAAITLKGYDWKVLPLLPSKVSNETGKFKFRDVPSKVAFFLDATYSFGGKTYRQFGLVRTGDGSTTTAVEIDVPSTLVSRLLLRIMQYAKTPTTINHPIDFRDLDPRDYNPLLEDLRELLAGGMPTGTSIDLSQVNQPDGDWTPEKDKADAAVRFLDNMRGTNQPLYQQIEFDMQRLADAVARNAKLFDAPDIPTDLLPPKVQ